MAIKPEETNKLRANKNYVNAQFKELHGRDAKQEELNEFTGKGTKDVRQAIQAGVPQQTEQPTIETGDTSANLLDRAPEEIQRIEAEQAQRFSEKGKETLNILKAQAEDARERRDKLQAQIDELKQQRQEEVVEPLESLTEPYREDLLKEGREEFDLKEKYNRYSELAQNLATYAEQAMGDIENLGNASMTMSFYQGSRQAKLDEMNTKISLTQTAMAGIKNDIALGRTFIDRGIEKIQQDRSERIGYLETVNNIISSEMGKLEEKEAQAVGRERESITNQIKTIREEFDRIEQEKNKVREFLLGDNADIAMKAGVKLTDSYDEMTAKVTNFYKENPDLFKGEDLTFDQKLILHKKGLSMGADGLPYEPLLEIPEGTLASRNNNPGNLRYAGQEGAREGYGGFAMFDTPEDGFNALMRQIELDAGRGKTLGEFIKKYAPPSENDTELYISQMEKWTGYSKDTKLTDIPTTTLAKNIAKKESGATFKTGETDEEDEESELLSINKIDKFRRNYGWTPPYGFTEDQLLQYMKDNPNATPEELEQGAKQALRERNGGQQEQPQQTQEPQQTVNEDYIKKQISTERLKEIADKLGKSSWLTPKSWDINRAMPDIMAKVETAQDKGYTTEEIINYLKNDL